MKRTILHALAAVLLVAATMAIWHWRFVVDPGALPETRLGKPLVGWSSKGHERHEVVFREGEAVLRLQKKDPTQKQPGVRIWFGALEQVRYIHVRCESRWQDVKPGKHSWHIARFAAHMKSKNGAISHPPGSHIFGGTGDSDWKKSEAVFKLTSDIADFGFAIAMLGETGTLEVRKLSVVAVRQRPWVPAATAMVVVGWTALFFSLIRIHEDRPGAGRSLATAALLVGACWLFVFPQTKSMLYPIPHSFSVGNVAAMPPPPEPAPEVALAPPGKPEKPPAAAKPKPPGTPPAAEKPKPPPAKPDPKPAPEPRDSGELHRAFREVDKRFGPAHLVLFTALTLMTLIITGKGSQWRLPLAIAVLAELVPELTDHLGGWDDWTDLLANFAGVGLAVLIWKKLPKLKDLLKRAPA